VTCTFVVSHAARVEVTNETLAELIQNQGVCSINVDECHIVEATNE